MSRDEEGERLSSRMAERLDVTDNPDNLDDTEKSDETDNRNNSDTIDPKEDWTGRMVYVPDGSRDGADLLEAFDGEYDRLQYECDWEVRKQLHYYPVVIREGTANIEELSGEEFTEIVEALGLR